jgi:hypothetical protein
LPLAGIYETMRHLARPFLFLSALACAGPALAQEPAAPKSPYGFAAGIFASSIFRGNAGPTTGFSEVNYGDTFDTGAGLRLEGFREFTSEARGQIGLVYARWPGKFFMGGAFPAGAQYDDFSVIGPYIGGRATYGSVGGFEPYLLANVGAVYLSSLTVQSGGATIPYWTGSWKEYFEAGIGVARRTGSGTLTFDIRLTNFGAPKAADPSIAEATSVLSLYVGLGYEWKR